MLIARKAQGKSVQPFPALQASSWIEALWRATRNAWTARRQAWEDRRSIAKAVAELSALDDMMLADMGIGRCGIYAAVTSNL